MTRIKFTVAYDGTGFCGWQKQNHEKRPSICQTLEEALEKIFEHKISLSASGRTDAGVHALNQVCHFDTGKDLARKKNWDLAWALRRFLPETIVVKKVSKSGIMQTTIFSISFSSKVIAKSEAFQKYEFTLFNLIQNVKQCERFLRRPLLQQFIYCLTFSDNFTSSQELKWVHSRRIY